MVTTGDGPGAPETTVANNSEASAPSEDVANDDATEVTTDAPEGGKDSETETATFRDKYVYEDGVAVEVTKIRHGKVKRADVEYADEAKAGDDFVVLTIRVKNGSKERIDSFGSATLTYGPDGEEAVDPYLASEPEEMDMSGKILPGRAKIATETFLIPAKYQEDPVLEFDFDSDHESAIFTGSLN